MSDLFDKLVEGAGQVISDVDREGRIESALTGIRHRLAEADRRRKVNLTKQQIQDLQAREAQAINSLSAQVWALYEAGTLAQPELLSLCKGLDAIRASIKDKEAVLAQLEPTPRQPVSPEAQNQCPSCGAAVVGGATFCQSCGSRLLPEQKAAPVLFCVHCGAQLRASARFCPKCGRSVGSDSS